MQTAVLPTRISLPFGNALSDEEEKKLKESNLYGSTKRVPPKDEGRPATLEELDDVKARHDKWFQDTSAADAPSMCSADTLRSDVSGMGYSDTTKDVETDIPDVDYDMRTWETEKESNEDNLQLNKNDADLQRMLDEMKEDVCHTVTSGFQEVNLNSYNCKFCFHTDKGFKEKVDAYKRDLADFEKTYMFWHPDQVKDVRPVPPDPVEFQGSPSIRQMDLSEAHKCELAANGNNVAAADVAVANIIKRHAIQGCPENSCLTVCRNPKCQFMAQFMTGPKALKAMQDKQKSTADQTVCNAGSERYGCRERLRDTIDVLFRLRCNRLIDKTLFDFEIDSLVRTHYYFYERARRMTAKLEGLFSPECPEYAGIVVDVKECKQNVLFYQKMWFLVRLPQMIEVRYKLFKTKGKYLPASWIKTPTHDEPLMMNDSEMLHTATRLHVFLQNPEELRYNDEGNPVCKVERGSNAHLILSTATKEAFTPLRASNVVPDASHITSELGIVYKRIMPKTVEIYIANGSDNGHANAQTRFDAFKAVQKIWPKSDKDPTNQSQFSFKENGKAVSSLFLFKDTQNALNNNRPLFETVKLKNFHAVNGFLTDDQTRDKSTIVQNQTFVRAKLFFRIMAMRIDIPVKFLGKDGKMHVDADKMAHLIVNEKNTLQSVIAYDKEAGPSASAVAQPVLPSIIATTQRSVVQDPHKGAVDDIIQLFKSTDISMNKNNTVQKALKSLSRRQTIQKVGVMIQETEEAIADLQRRLAVEIKKDLEDFDKKMKMIVTLQNALMSNQLMTLDIIFEGMQSIIPSLQKYVDHLNVVDMRKARSSTFANSMKQASSTYRPDNYSKTWLLKKMCKNGRDEIDERVDFANHMLLRQCVKDVDDYRRLAYLRPEFLRPGPHDHAGPNIALRNASGFYTFASWLKVRDQRLEAKNPDAFLNHRGKLEKWIYKQVANQDLEDDFFRYLMCRFNTEYASRYHDKLYLVDVFDIKTHGIRMHQVMTPGAAATLKDALAEELKPNKRGRPAKMQPKGIDIYDDDRTDIDMHMQDIRSDRPEHEGLPHAPPARSNKSGKRRADFEMHQADEDDSMDDDDAEQDDLDAQVHHLLAKR